MDQRRLIKTSENPIKHKFQNDLIAFIDEISIERKLSDNKMECFQFGICDYFPAQLEEIPFLLSSIIYYFLNKTDKGKLQSQIDFLKFDSNN